MQKVVKSKADVAAHLTFLVFCGSSPHFRRTSALAIAQDDDWQLGRPTAARLLSAFPRIQSALQSARFSSVLYRPGATPVPGTGRGGAWKRAFILTLDSPAKYFTNEL